MNDLNYLETQTLQRHKIFCYFIVTMETKKNELHPGLGPYKTECCGSYFGPYKPVLSPQKKLIRKAYVMFSFF